LLLSFLCINSNRTPTTLEESRGPVLPENTVEDDDDADMEFEAALSQIPLDDIVTGPASQRIVDKGRTTTVGDSTRLPEESTVHPEVAALIESGGLDWLDDDGDLSF
jgi:hypothetical protein